MGLNGLYGIASYLPDTYVISMTTGNSISGIFMNIVRYITIYIYYSPNEEEKDKQFFETLIYYSISTLICIISLIFTFIVYNDEYFKSKFKQSGELELELPSHKISLVSVSDTENNVINFLLIPDK